MEQVEGAGAAGGVGSLAVQLARQRGAVVIGLASVANLVGVDLSKAVARYAGNCPRCGATPCVCPVF